MHRNSSTSRFQLYNASGNNSLPTSTARTYAPTDHDRWHPRGQHSHSRSLSNFLGNMSNGRARAGSASAGEIVSALKAPISWKLIILCLIWYLSSALSNTSSKSILNSFNQPLTLTIVQFGFVSSWCVALSFFARFSSAGRSIPGLKDGLRWPTRFVIATTAPLAFFQVGGHIFSSIATSRIAVSLVHTIKGMSPLFTVFAYRFLFNIHYSMATYISLVPLTIGVMLACSTEFRGNFIGVFCAFTAAIIFVSQNIFSKKLFNESSSTAADPTLPEEKRKLDKLNLLCYSSGMAFILTMPLWFYYEGFTFLAEYIKDGSISLSDKGKHGEAVLTGWELIMEFIFNGTVHFGQNIIAFVLLSMVSPVTYSVGSLVKRIFVIVVAIVWFGSSTTTIQGFGIALTFFGLYLYDRAGDVAKGEQRVRLEQTRGLDPLLPLTTVEPSNLHQSSAVPAHFFAFAEPPISTKAPPGLNGYALGAGDNEMNGTASSGWLPPGQEDTFKSRETAVTG